MKKSFILPAITGFILLIAFQNCSQGNFESAGTAQIVAPTKIVFSDDQIQNFLTRDRIEICPSILCAAPPENCRYEKETASELAGTKNRCPASCGKLVCDRQPPIIEDPPTEPILCPMIACSPVPDGCQRVAAVATVKDSKGCDLNCGEIKCEGEPQEVFIGPKPPIDEIDNSGNEPKEVAIGVKPPIMCPMIMCAAPPKGCFYRPTSRRSDRNECPGCGELICKKVPFETQPVEPNDVE